MFYGSITGNEWNTTADNQPFTLRQSFPTVFTLSDPYRNLPGGVGPFPFEYSPDNAKFAFPAQVFGPSLDFRWPFIYQANVTIQREIGRGMSASASYVGAFARNLAAPVDRNYPVMTSTATVANLNARRPYQPGVIAAANVLESIFTSDYNGLQLSAERRGSELSFKANYTFGRALEDVDFQGADCRRSRTRLSSTRSVAAHRQTGHTTSDCRWCGSRTSSRTPADSFLFCLTTGPSRRSCWCRAAPL